MIIDNLQISEVTNSILVFGVAMIGVRLVILGLRMARDIIDADGSGLSVKEYRSLDYEDRKYFR